MHYATAELAIASVDEDWGRLVAQVGPCGLLIHAGREPFEALVRSIAYQQLHGKAADAILKRFLDLYGGASFPSAETVLATESSVLRAVGFSISKIAAIRAIATASTEGIVPTRAEALAMADEALIERLVAIRGVGRWTVEMLLMHTLGRADIFPVDDFGVREGYRLLKGWPAQPTRRQLADAGEALRPHRSVASWYLWRAVDRARAVARAAGSPTVTSRA